MSNEFFIMIISVLIGIHVKLYREDKQKVIRLFKLMVTYCVLWFFPFKHFDYKNEQKIIRTFS